MSHIRVRTLHFPLTRLLTLQLSSSRLTLALSSFQHCASLTLTQSLFNTTDTILLNKEPSQAATSNFLSRFLISVYMELCPPG